MEPLFISQWTHDNHSLYELVPIFRKHPSRILLITMPMVIIIVIFFLALWGIFGFQDYTWLIPLPAACFYFIYVFIDPYLRIHNSFKNKNDFENTLDNKESDNYDNVENYKEEEEEDFIEDNIFDNKENSDNEISNYSYEKNSNIASVKVSEDEDPFSSASDSSWDNDIKIEDEHKEYEFEEDKENIDEEMDDINNNDENEDDYLFEENGEDNYMFGDDEEEEFFFDNESR